MPPVTSRLVYSKDEQGFQPLKSGFSLYNSLEGKLCNNTPSGTPNTFYGMLTRNSLLDTPMYSTSRKNRSISSDSSLYLCQSQVMPTTSLESSQYSLDASDSMYLLAATQRTIATLTTENEELREHIGVLSNALQSSTTLLDRKEQLIQERDTLIRELATRLLLDRQRQL